MARKRDYTTEASKLARVIEIAIDSLKKYPLEGWSESQLAYTIRTYAEWKQKALHPAPQYRKLASLDYLIQDTMTLFQEGNGRAIDFFWEQVARERLGYKRIDKLQKILNRGRLTNRSEFNYITDTLVAAKQQGRIDEGEADRLSEMLGAFEEQKSS